MGIKKSSGNKATNLPAGIALGVLFSLVITFAGAAAITQLVTMEKIEDNSIGYGIIAVLLIASMFGAWIAANQTKRLRLQVCLLEGAGYFLVLLTSTALFFGGQYQGIWASGITILLGCTLMAFFPSLGHKKWKAKNRAYR